MTAIIATPNAANGRATGGNTGDISGVTGCNAIASSGIAAMPATLARVNAPCTRLAVETPTTLIQPMARIDTAATTPPAETVHGPADHRMRDVPNAGTK